MAEIIIVDTDILIDASRGINDALVCLEQIEQQSALAISVVTEMELIVGCRNKAELRSLEKFLDRFEVIALSEQISALATDLLRRYRLSHGLLIADALIAATAIMSGAAFVSKNRTDYRFMTDLVLLPYPNPFLDKP